MNRPPCQTCGTNKTYEGHGTVPDDIVAVAGFLDAPAAVGHPVGDVTSPMAMRWCGRCVAEGNVPPEVASHG